MFLKEGLIVEVVYNIELGILCEVFKLTVIILVTIHVEEGNLNWEVVDDTSYVPANVGVLHPCWNTDSSLTLIDN